MYHENTFLSVKFVLNNITVLPLPQHLSYLEKERCGAAEVIATKTEVRSVSLTQIALGALLHNTATYLRRTSSAYSSSW